jgi:xanthine/CO dehydrogenase XdhC/CoxF family maturation factor
MVIDPRGGRTGSVSGGCLEAEIVRKGWWLTEGGPAVFSYDNLSEEDPASGYATGCRGLIHVLLERVGPGGLAAWRAMMTRCLDGDASGWVALVCGVEGDAGVRVGERMLLEGGRATHAFPTELASWVHNEIQESHGRARLPRCVLANGCVDVLLEPVRPPVKLTILGAGFDAAPLARLAHELGWRVTVIDRKPVAVTRERIPSADRVLQFVSTSEGLAFPTDADAAVVMAHHYPTDAECLRVLLASGVSYLGVLGPRRRTEELLRELADQGASITPDALARMRAPVGLDIGAETPEEIALAIVAEIKASLAGRGGGPLRDRNGPIHEPVTNLPAPAATPASACGVETST